MDITLQTAQIALPFGKVAGNWKIWLWGTPFEYLGADPSTVFTGVPNGSYQVAAERQATDGTRIGEQVLRPYTHTGGEMVDVVIGISVDGTAL